MSSVKTARNTIAAAVEALTPLDAGRAYVHHEARGRPRSADGHRRFWIVARSGGVPQEYGAASMRMSHELELHIVWRTAGLGTDEVLDLVTDDAAQIVGALSGITSYPAGVEHIEATRYEITPLAHMEALGAELVDDCEGTVYVRVDTTEDV